MDNGSKDFWMILLAGVFLRLVLVFSLPLYPIHTGLPGYNDEPMHLNYVSHLSQSGDWPVWTEAASQLNPLIDEFPQPPLYYDIALPAYKIANWFSHDSGIYGARLTSLLLGIMAAVVVFKLLKRMAVTPAVALAGFAFMIFSPTLVIFTSIVTNDALLLLASALFMFGLVDFGKYTATSSKTIGLGVLLALAIWSKMSAVALVPLVLFAGGSDNDPRILWVKRFKILAAALVFTAPLLVWNYQHYQALIPTVSIYTPLESRDVLGSGITHPWTAVTYLARTFVQPMDQVWGNPLEKISSLIWLIAAFYFFIGGSVELWKSEYRRVLMAGIAFPTLALIAYNVRFFQIEARLLAPAVVPIAVIFAMGITRSKTPLFMQYLFWALPLIVFVSS